MTALHRPENRRFDDVEQLHESYSPSKTKKGLYYGLAILQPIRWPKIPEDRLFPYEDAMPCKNCQAMTVKDLLSPGGYRHHDSLAMATVAANDGCKICNLIVQQFSLYMNHHDPADWGSEPVILKFANSTGTPYCQDDLRAKVGESTAILGLYTDEGNMASDWLPGRRVARHPDPEAVVELLKRWIERSSKRQQKYPNENQPQKFPKRLIDVSKGDGSIVYLTDFSQISVQNFNPKGYYICLSHRWDSTTALHTTTTANFSTRLRGIPTNNLPQTFADAIYLTRALGLKYIWIDSYCILQDSLKDWEEESAKMGTYYNSSWLTIGAGVESSKGLFGTRDETSDNIQYYRMILHSPDPWILYFTATPTTWSLGNDQDSILRERAWAFQEEVLSPRYLGFQQSMMFYRSGDYIDFEDGLLQWIRPPEQLIAYGEEPLQESDLYGDWYHFVTAYSRRDLTKDGDKLPALSGLAHRRQMVLKDEYLAGLWRVNLLRELCWHKESVEGPSTRPPQYRAPTWSWAALNCPVTLSFRFLHYPSNEFEVELLHASVDTLGLDPLGAVKSGFLKLAGIIRPGMRIRGDRASFDESHDGSDRDAFVLLDADGNIECKTDYSFRPDTTDFPDSVQVFWFLNVTSQLGLALLPIPSSKFPWSEVTYERVGFIEVYQDWRSKEVVSLDKSLRRRVVNII